MLEAIILAVLACVVAFFFMGRGNGKPVAAPSQPPPPAEEAKQEAKAAAAAAAKTATGGKKGKKDDKKHPQCLFVCKGHTGEITCSRISMTGKMMCSTGEDRKVILWNIAALPPTAQLTFSPELDHGAAIAMSPDDKFFAVVFARSKEVKIFSTKGAKEGAQVSFGSKHTTDVTDLIWSYSGRFLVTFACKDKEAVRIWTPRGEALGAINPGALESYGVRVSPDSRFISVATMQCDAKVWEVGTDKDGFGLKGKAMELTGRTGGGGAAGHSSAVHGVDFGGSSPARLVADSTAAVTGSKDGLCKVWNINVRYRQSEDPKCTLTIQQPDKRPISHVAISRGKEAKYVATWSASAGLIFWALPSGDQVSVISAEESGQVFHMEWFESEGPGQGDLLFCSGSDGRSRAWLPVCP